MTTTKVAVNNTQNHPSPIVVTLHDETLSSSVFLTVEEAQNLVTEVAAGIARRKQHEAQHAKGEK